MKCTRKRSRTKTNSDGRTIGEEFRYDLARRLPYLLTERKLDFGNCDKIFSSSWLSEDQVVVGTKCNKLYVVDVTSGKRVLIPCLGSPPVSTGSRSTCGIHNVCCSPSHEWLATGGANPNHLALYHLPEFQPISLGTAHSDWLFDLKWISDHLLISASRDSSMALWSVDSTDKNKNVLAEEISQMDPIFQFSNLNSQSHRRNNSGERVRSLAYDKHNYLLGSLQSNPVTASLHLWDAFVFQQVSKVQLPYSAENVCLEVEPEIGTQLYVVGSRSHVTFIDGRHPHKPAGFLKSPDKDCGVRSLNFNQELLSIGTGAGNIFFHDLRAGSFLSNSEQPHCLHTSPGWLRNDETYREFFSGLPQPPNALYSHCYSPLRTKLFVAGGPLPLGLHGNYAGVWL